jgi:hypothetical protein
VAELEEFQPSEFDAADIAKGGGIGLAKGAINAAGGMGDVRGFASAGLDRLLAPETAQAIKDRAYQAAGLTPLGTIIRDAPSSSDIQNGIESQMGPFYTPKTDGGRLAENLGERVPMAIIGGTRSPQIQAIIAALKGW